MSHLTWDTSCAAPLDHLQKRCPLLQVLCVVPAACAWMSLAGPQQLHACSTPAVAALAEEPAVWHSGTLKGAADSWLRRGVL